MTFPLSLAHSTSVPQTINLESIKFNYEYSTFYVYNMVMYDAFNLWGIANSKVMEYLIILYIWLLHGFVCLSYYEFQTINAISLLCLGWKMVKWCVHRCHTLFIFPPYPKNKTPPHPITHPPPTQTNPELKGLRKLSTNHTLLLKRKFHPQCPQHKHKNAIHREYFSKRGKKNSKVTQTLQDARTRSLLSHIGSVL